MGFVEAAPVWYRVLSQKRQLQRTLGSLTVVMRFGLTPAPPTWGF